MYKHLIKFIAVLLLKELAHSMLPDVSDPMCTGGANLMHNMIRVIAVAAILAVCYYLGIDIKTNFMDRVETHRRELISGAN